MFLSVRRWRGASKCSQCSEATHTSEKAAERTEPSQPARRTATGTMDSDSDRRWQHHFNLRLG